MRKALIMLGELNDGDLEWCAKTGQRRVYDPGTTIIAEGVEIQFLLIILDGLAVVKLHGKEIARLASGDLAGEVSMIDQRPTAATVIAEIETVVLTIARTDLAEKLKKDVGFACRFYHAVSIFLADRLRSTNNMLRRGDTVIKAAEIDLEDELGEDILDKVYIAGAKFDKFMKQIMKAE